MKVTVTLAAGILCAFGLGGATAVAQTPPGAAAGAPQPPKPRYEVLSSSELFISLPSSGVVSSVQVLDRSKGTVTNASSATHVAPASSPWWDVVFPSDIFKITDPPTTYDVLYQVGGKPAPPLEVSLSPKLGITIGTNGALIRDYWLGNNIALKVGDQYIMDGDSANCVAPATGDWRVFSLKDKTKTKTLHGKIQFCTAPIVEARKNPAALGTIRIRLDYALVLRLNSFTIDPADGNAILSGVTVDQSLSSNEQPVHVVFADSATFNPQSGPASKDAAMFYANLQIAAGTGAAPAWGIDGKVALFNEPFLHGTTTLLSATANTGHNTSNIKNTTFTDTIDWMLPSSWAFSLWKRAPTTLTLIAGPKYETDYQFDKKNFLFSGDSIWTPRKLYQPQNYRSKAKDGVMPKYGDDGYAKVGYELEFHAGVESGGALIDTTVQNTTKTQSINVPAYSIERVVPQIHALYQQNIYSKWFRSAGLLSFDWMYTARYLFDAENTVRQAADASLSIKQVSGWKAISTLTSTWNPPKSNNVGLTVTFKDGFDAPKFSRVNSVLIGVLIEF
jgi:hypothetical protein